jgi:hypothetical protein
MKPSLAMLIPMVFRCGCIPLRQEERVSGPVDPALLLCEDRYVLAGIDMHREKIVPEASFITDPKGRRYGMQLEPHQFDIEQKSQALRTEVHPCNAGSSRLRRWSNGVWSFPFVVEGKDGIQVIEKQQRYWTFYYNPIIHGPPN